MKKNEKIIKILIFFIICLVITSILFIVFRPKSENKKASQPTESQKETYTITFDSNGGSSVSDIKVNAGEKLKLPNKPRRAGYEFSCWVNSDNEAILDGHVVNSNMKLTAKWIKEDALIFTVTFDSVGGTYLAPIKVASDEPLVLPKNPTKEGYTFLRWEDENGTPVRNDVILFKDTNLTAIWKENYTCPAGYEKNGTKCTKTVDQTIKYTCSKGELNEDLNLCLVERIDATENKVCDEGYELKGEKCIAKEKSEEEVKDNKCPDNYLLKDDACYLITDVKIEKTCPEDTVTVGGLCYKNIKPTEDASCPKDYEKVTVNNKKMCKITIDATRN